MSNEVFEMKKMKNMLFEFLFIALMLGTFVQPVFAGTTEVIAGGTMTVLSTVLGTETITDPVEVLVIIAVIFLMIYGFLEVLGIFKGVKTVSIGLGLLFAIIVVRTLVYFQVLSLLISLGSLVLIFFLLGGILFAAYGWYREKKKGANLTKVNSEMSEKIIKTEQNLLNQSTKEMGHLNELVMQLLQKRHDMIATHHGKDWSDVLLAREVKELDIKITALKDNIARLKSEEEFEKRQSQDELSKQLAGNNV